jgi:manganese transport protein
MDPGNWATDLQAGSTYGYALLSVILASSLIGIILQILSARLGIAARQDLARACREHYPPQVRWVLWVMAEVAIVATDVAEVIGSALALHLLFGLSLMVGIVLTSFDTLIVLGLKGRGFRQIEAIMLGLIGTIAICFGIQLVMAQPDWGDVLRGFVPDQTVILEPDRLYLAIGILGATVMPHNLYLHSSIVQTRKITGLTEGRRDALRLAGLDTIASLLLALAINASIIIVAGAVFHARGETGVVEIQGAYRLLEPLLGSHLAPVLFGLALLASGQSSTFTGTIAGQVMMEGFLEMKMPCWQRRLITRGLALVPAAIGVYWLGEAGVGKLLVLSQVVLSLQLPFAVWPLLRFTGSARIMGVFANGKILQPLGWASFALITVANLWLLATML